MKLSVPAPSFSILLLCCLLVAVKSSQFCRAPSEPNNGDHNGGWRKYFSSGSVLTFSCNRGYWLQGTNRLTCVRSFSSYKWNYPPPRCVRRSCPRPSFLRNGRIIARSFSVGASIKYICNSGFVIKGSSSRRCLSSRKWSGSAPLCIGRRCPFLRPPSNGGIRYTRGRNVGDKVWYFCKQGFSLTGQESRTCLKSLSWSGSRPVCSCGRPARPANGRVSYSRTSVGSLAKYSCNSGFTLAGAKLRVCQRSGRWSPNVPVCKPRPSCPRLSAPQNGGFRLSYGQNAGSTASYFCQSGFLLKGSKTRVCLSNGVWTGQKPSCQRVICPILTIPKNGWIKLTKGRNVGSTASYSCLSGFVLKGDKTRVCRSNGAWSGSDPLCLRPVLCPSLPAPNNGFLKLSNGRREGSTARYFCNSGFILVGDSTRVCGSNRKWSGQAPTCSQPSCPILKVPSRGSIKLSNGLKVGSKATYSCSSGYSLVGNRERVCQSNAVWSGKDPVCTRNMCPILPNITNGSVDLSNGTVVGAIATYSCVPGYILEGDNRRTCQSNGQWNGREPSCRIANCGDLQKPTNGAVRFSPNGSTTFGARAIYTCNAGFTLQGNKTRFCQENEQWSGSPPKCVANMCIRLENIENGRVDLSGTFVGAVANYSCDAGYILDGGRIRECQRNGEWSGSEPTCEIADCGVLSNPRNGTVRFNGTVFRSRALYTCNSGFNIQGDRIRTCGADGTWSGTEPKCLAVMCEDLPNITNGQVVLTGRFVNAIATYSCNPGYILEGNKRRVCQRNGQWSGSVPSCRIADCGPLLNPENGRVVFLPNNTEFRTCAIYICNSGFSLQGNRSRICQANEIWSGSEPTCAANMCDVLENITNGSVELSGTAVGDTATYTCEEGYILQGNRRRVCQRDSSWTGFEPTCRIANCGSLSSPTNGQVTFAPLGSTLFGAVATYECDPGYTIEGDKTRICQANEEWSGSEPRCRPNMCGALFDIDNGRVELNGQFVGAIANYSCVTGYLLEGNERRTCQLDGEWSGQEPSCNIADCGTLPNPDNGRVSFPATVFNSTAEYTCDDGYILRGDRTRVCQENQTWSGTAPTCAPNMCDNLNNITNGRVELSGNFVGATATYFCVIGYNLVGNRQRVCQGNGQWDGVEPSCKIVNCGFLQNPLDGLVQLLNGTTVFGSRAMYSCNTGFTLQGNKNRVCQADEMWSGSVPKCIPTTCDTLPDITNGNVSISGTSIGSTATYFCEIGFILAGNKERICQNTGQWSGMEPSCKIVDCRTLPNPRNGQVRFEPDGSTVFGSKAEYSCSSGFTLRGGPVRICQVNGIWSGAPPTCVENMCDRLENIANGRVILSGTFVGAVANYSCDLGYTLDGNVLRECQSSGQWTGSEPTCNIVDCKSLSNPRDGTVEFPSTTFRSLATYTCDLGFSLNGTETRECQANGSWSGEAPTCPPVMCGELADILNGRVDLSGNFVGATATYSCDIGYVVDGISQRTCQIDGNWDGIEPSCRIIDCGPLPNPRDGQVSFSPRGSTTFGAVANYSCNFGFTLQGDLTRTCQQNESWSGSQPTCVRDTLCPDLFDPDNGEVILSGRSVGSLAQYSCGVGFILTGREVRVCQRSGDWNGTAPTCIPVQCDDLASPENGVVLVENTTLGSPAQYFCNSGFELVGNNIRICLETGQWSSEAPICQAILCPVLTDPANGMVQFNNTAFSLAVYTCNEGFMLEGERLRICLSIGIWTGLEPKCISQLPGCGDPGTPVNGRRIGGNFSVGDVVFFRCFDDFDLVGAKFRVCQPDGWSGVQPICNPFNRTCRAGVDHYDRCMRLCTCKDGKFEKCTRMRSDYAGLTPSQRLWYINALIYAVRDPIYGPRYNKLIDLYTKSFSNPFTQSTTPSESQFFMFNRYFLLEFEDLLRDQNCSITIPYYDWTPFPIAPYTAAVWSNTDGFGDTARLSDNCVSTGPVRVGEFSLTPNSGGGCLKREYENRPFPSRDQINRDLLPVPVEEFFFFHRTLHLFINVNIRCFIGGTMCSSNTANDPVYLLHMAQLDAILTRWQDIGAGRETVRYSDDGSKLLGTPFVMKQFANNTALPYGTCIAYNQQAIEVPQTLDASSSSPLLDRAFPSGMRKMECNPMEKLMQATKLTDADVEYLRNLCY